MRTLFLWFITIALASPARSQALIGYYAGDGADLYDRAIGKLTHLIWCFARLDGDSLAPLTKAEDKVLRKMVGFKREYPDLKVLISFGGWGNCASCSEVFARPEGRKAFARSVHALLKRTWTDGIDLDWEYPAVQGPPGHAFSDADRHNFTLLVRDLRAELGTRYELSFAAGGTEACLRQGFEWDSIIPVVDRVHLMTYDLVHGYSTTTGHHTPLISAGSDRPSADGAVRLVEQLGVPRSKVVIGSAFYTRVFKEVPADADGLGQPGVFSHTIPWSAMDTTITGAKGWTIRLDKKSQATFAYHAADRLFATYDDLASVAAKARYVKDRGLGGIMFWQLLDDRTKGGLLDAMHNALREP